MIARSRAGAADAFLPLTPKVFHIMLALADTPQNGYQLAIVVEQATRGRIRLSPGTLYENLNRLQERGLIREATMADQTDGRGQRFWRLTALGVRVLRAEVERLRSDIKAAEGIAALQEG